MHNRSVNRLAAKLETLRPGQILASFLIVSGLMYLPFILSGFAYDDFFWITILEEKLPYRWWAGFWDVDPAKLPAFQALWYADTDNPGRFFRPLFSWIFASAFHLFGRGAAPFLHALFAALHACTAFLVFLNARVFLRPLAALAAGTIFLICPHHIMTVGWISTATDVLSALLVLASVYVLLASQNSLLALILSPGLFGLALLAKESSVAGAPVLVLAAYFKSGSLRAFARSFEMWAPALAIACGYLVFYGAAGFGTQNAMYSNPFTEPVSFAKTAAVRAGILFLGGTTILPAGLTLFFERLQPWAAAAGFLLAGLLCLLGAELRRLPAVRFALLSFAVCLLPQLAVDASERQLYLPLTFGAVLLSVCLFQAPFLSTSGGIAIVRGWRAHLLWTHTAFHFAAAAAILSTAYALSYPASFALPEQRTRDALSLAAGAERIVFVNSPGPFFTFYAPDIARYSGGPTVRFLAGMNGRVWCRREGRFLFVKTDTRGWLTSMFAKLARKSAGVEKRRRLPFG